ncbi:hypothetical protein T11_10000 [Trichinella zimbabwensis]|uniref:Uncharacterized protein n=1 Tax=Trichinella zimbabwensis TaxID=268475 RepID=A0A0V1HLI8_9BILA|nr:hypothetical protein T11_10000 [Trichinella zimbabwensis]
MTFRVEPVQERSVMRMLKTIHSLHALEEDKEAEKEKGKCKAKKNKKFSHCFKEATRLKVKALFSGHELNFPPPVTQSWLKQSRLSTGLVNDTLAKVRIVT